MQDMNTRQFKDYLNNNPKYGLIAQQNPDTWMNYYENYFGMQRDIKRWLDTECIFMKELSWTKVKIYAIGFDNYIIIYEEKQDDCFQRWINEANVKLPRSIMNELEFQMSRLRVILLTESELENDFGTLKKFIQSKL